MRRTLFALLALAAVLVLTARLSAADTPLDPGLKPGKTEVPGPFCPFNVTGNEKHRGTYHSLVSEHGLNPVALVLVRGVEPGPKLLTLLQQLDALVDKNRDLGFGSFVVFLSDDIMDLLKEDAKREAAAATVLDKTGKLKHVAAAVDLTAHVKDGFKLNDKAEVTVLFYNKLRVESAHAFAKDALNDEAIKSIVDEMNGKLAALRVRATGKMK